MEKGNIMDVLEAVPELQRNWATIWDQSRCLRYKNPKDPTGKPIFVKDLGTMMAELGIMEKEDILIVDDDALKCFFNHSQSLNPPSYYPEMFKTDSFLQSFLDILADLAEGIPVADIKKKHPKLNRTKEINPEYEKIVMDNSLRYTCILQKNK
jgi:hypothetical protein